MQIEYDKNLHSVFLLQYHLILVVKYRREVIDDKICARLKEIFEYIAKNDNYSLELIEFNHDKDHLHILFKAKPKSELLKFINAYKYSLQQLFWQCLQREYVDFLWDT